MADPKKLLPLAAMDPDKDEARALAKKTQDLDIEARLRIERLGKSRSL